MDNKLGTSSAKMSPTDSPPAQTQIPYTLLLNSKIPDRVPYQELKGRHSKSTSYLPSESSTIMKSITLHKRVTINVGGVKYEILWKTLKRLPLTRLGRLMNCNTHEEIIKLCDDYSLNENEYFFNRQPRSFSSILHFYCTGKLHLAEDMCSIAFCEDLEYWGIHELDLEPCCENKYFQEKEYVQKDVRNQLEFVLKCEVDKIEHHRFSQYQMMLWDLLEKPNSSYAARVLRCISILAILLSTLALTLNTLPKLQERDSGAEGNLTLNHTNPNQERDSRGVMKANPALKTIERVCISWFTLEYLLRFMSAPNKWKFFKGALNIIDLLAILPYFIKFLIKAWSSAETYQNAKRIVGFFQTMRILMILKLARHSKGFQTLGCTLHNSSKELGLLMLFLYMGIMIFSTLAYFAEKNEPGTQFTSIPEAYWWASISMITMNIASYNGMCPTTTMGKAVGVVCCLCGVLVIALPIPIIINNFTDYYNSQKMQEKAMERYEAINRARRASSVATFKQPSSLSDAFSNNKNLMNLLDGTEADDDQALDEQEDADNVGEQPSINKTVHFQDEVSGQGIDNTTFQIAYTGSIAPVVFKQQKHHRYASA